MNKNRSFKNAVSETIRNFSANIKESVQESPRFLYIPDNVLAFMVPLDFYVPLHNPYVATIIDGSAKEITEVRCVTVFSDVVKVGDSSVKHSYVIASVCSNAASRASKNERKDQLLEILEIAISEINNLISSLQALPSRHNHYFRTITVQSISGAIWHFTFNYKTSKILKSNKTVFHQNALSDMAQTKPLSQEELHAFQKMHIDKAFNDDKIYKLISKINDAVNLRCMG